MVPTCVISTTDVTFRTNEETSVPALRDFGLLPATLTRLALVRDRARSR
jgi:hypothetical protein